MEIPAKYEANKVEDKWYKHWMDKNHFHSEPDGREAYTVVLPPPNVTGILHMGHMLNSTIQDVLVRRARMLGKNACWVPGTDHASIATEAKVVNKLRAEGIKKSDLTREEFLRHAMEWKDKHGGIILEQLKKIGASCDWDRTAFTMDKEYGESVIDVFIDLYNKGKIYRGVRMVNWDPAAQTALSDEEVIHKEVNSKFYSVRYQVEGTDDWMVIATTRPETILGDSAVCVNPNDARYANLVGKNVIVPIANRVVPIIADDYVDMEFGTGCLKVTPAHDINDYEIGKRHKLETIDVFNANGTLNHFGLHYEGKDRFEVRKEIVKELEEKGFLVKVEDHINKVGFSERTDAVIEPRLSMQWFVDMKELSKPALENVMNGNINFYPDNMKNTYRHWMENIKDWCISRQLWWGHQIPAWYCDKNCDQPIISKTKPEKCPHCGSTNLKQDEDVLDTWFSSWLWPISVFNGLTQPNNKDIQYYYPSNDLVTAPEIMFFWVARMIIAGYEWLGDKPFSNVYYTGIVRDKLGRKMSKSLGNSPDPIQLMEDYGADGVRLGMLLSSPAGNDLPFDTDQCIQGRNFTNKIWNAFRLVSGWEVKEIEQPEYAKLAVNWFENKFNETLAHINDQFDKFRISDALMASYKLIWDDFCSWYLEMIKPEYQQPIDAKTKEQTLEFFEKLMKIIHPFTPFISEEVWHLLRARKEGEDIIVAAWPKLEAIDSKIIADFEIAFEIISNIRNIRKQNNIANKIAIDFFIENNKRHPKYLDAVVEKMGNIGSLSYTSVKPENVFSFITNTTSFYIPFGENVDVEAELQKLKEELDYTIGFMKSTQKKLGNERFVNGAPEQVVAMEKKKLADAQEKIKLLEEKIAEISK
ncbi:MAG: valine--tRNA ligase [Brumimicrobium sp.]|nr:valine--tRNA ligase [Brumimicrobium sp.]